MYIFGSIESHRKEKKDSDTFSLIVLYITLYHSISLYITLYHSISLYITLYHSISLYITLYHFTSLYITLYHSISLYITLYHSISLYITLYHSLYRPCVQTAIHLPYWQIVAIEAEQFILFRYKPYMYLNRYINCSAPLDVEWSLPDDGDQAPTSSCHSRRAC